MPTYTPRWSQLTPLQLAQHGEKVIRRFCELNSLPPPSVNIKNPDEWHVGACAYYRPDTEFVRKWTTPGISICLEECARICDNSRSRNYSWPGNLTDREPYGVICHELGHHVDWLSGEQKGKYWSNYSFQLYGESKEDRITSYCPNPCEWFAEMFRVFITNPRLLEILRPRTYEILSRKWKTVNYSKSWTTQLGSDVPQKILNTLKAKGAI